ncbi:MAG TPA: hypothetical protein VKR61_21925, partial [Bryobacteraceae bacterium]|nr:hypothetical protein [Bryobacteraceae bacterium]
MRARLNGAIAAALFALNIWICWRWFRVEYAAHFNSVEGFFIAMARYISTHWSGFSWWPMWHCGMPYQDTYVPLLHLVVAAVATVAKVSAAQAYHDVTGVSYSLGAVTVFLMAQRLGASRGAAFLAALAYSIVSPSVLLMPDVARDVGWFHGRRLQVLTVYGEGPHITSLAILPLDVLALQSALEKRTARSLVLAGLAIAAMFLTNVPGTMALGLAVFCWIVVQPAESWWRAVLIAVGASALAYAIACYGVPPSSLRTVLSNVGAMHIGFRSALDAAPFLLALVLMAAAIFGFLLRYSQLPLFARFGLLYFGVLAGMVLTAQPRKFELLPQASRLHVEMEIAACLLLGGLAWRLYKRSPRWAKPVLALLLLAAVIVQVRNYHAKVRADVQPVDLSARSEYTTARWLEANMSGRRVYAAGSDAFWLNAFTDTPQVLGCCEQGMSMPIQRIVPYMVSPNVNDEFTRLGVAYLEAMGAQALVTSGETSTDEYKDIKAPERYAAILPVLHQDRGDVIYGVPQRSASLAHLLLPGEEAPVRSSREVTPAEIQRYANAIEESRPPADFQWTGPGAARIRAVLRPGEMLSV